MSNKKRTGIALIVTGVLLASGMCLGLWQSFATVPDGSSPADLAQAIGIWALGAAVGAGITWLGFVRLGSAWLRKRAGQK